MEDNFFGKENAVILGLGELRVGTCPMGTIGLGSCVALILHDRRRLVGGLAHIMLPESRGNTDRPGKFADTATDTLILEIERLGGASSTTTASIVGGASMFKFSGNSLNIGERNAAAVRGQLEMRGIRVVHEEIGGSIGRSVYYWPEKEGRLVVRRADGTCTRF